MPNQDGTGKKQRRRSAVTAGLRNQIAMHRTIAGEVISLAHLLGRPVVDPDGNRVGRVNDVAVHWDAGSAHPRVSGVVVSVSKGLALVSASEVILEQRRVRLVPTRVLAATPVRDEGDIALARDVLDRQVVDVEGVQVVRASDVYLLRLSDGWELAGVDVGFRAYARRLLPKRRRCPPPDRAVDWADLQTFVPGAANPGTPGFTGPAAAAGTVGSGIQLGNPAKDLHKLRARDVAALISDLGRREQAQVASLATPSAAAEVLRGLSQEHRDALLAELSESDRARLVALLRQDDPT
ncbi:MAG: magnesium transporter MgtE N-terminal domain-containing protein [Acidimicrobiales bacterium]